MKRLHEQCEVCRQQKHKRPDAEKMRAALQVAQAFAFCPGCLQLALSRHDPAYRRRARAFLKRAGAA